MPNLGKLYTKTNLHQGIKPKELDLLIVVWEYKFNPKVWEHKSTTTDLFTSTEAAAEK